MKSTKSYKGYTIQVKYELGPDWAKKIIETTAYDFSHDMVTFDKTKNQNIPFVIYL